jgi:predicted nuclease of predicted toxin-antitoxin system
VNFLVDNQLPVALCRFLTDHGHKAHHVLDVHLEAASDLEIWNYAASRDWIVASKDEDFLHLANRQGDTGKLIWVRLATAENRRCCRFLKGNYQIWCGHLMRGFRL